MLLWNYRGYGRSRSTGACGNSAYAKLPSPEIIRDDAESILRYLRQQIGVRGKIGIYGRSLGGIAASHLSKYVDISIVDRSFANLDETVEIKFFGKSALALYKIGTCCWRSNNARNFIDTLDEIPLVSEPDEDKTR